MKIVFDHIEGWGKICKSDLIYAPCWAYPEGESSDDMLEAGWLPWQGRWFPARSVRLELAAVQFGRTVQKCSRKIQALDRRPTVAEMEYIAHFYMEKKSFCSPHVFKEIFDNPNYRYITFSHNNKVVGFIAYLLFQRSFVGVQFAWDYETPQLSLGSVSTYLEVEIARREGCQHYYMMGGYEVDSAYKAQLGGFEWWTGQVWSQDRSIYLELCSRDSRIILENHGHI
jgi:hypothetical protein